MASYDDGTNIGFWDDLRPRRGEAWKQGKLLAQPEDAFLGDDCEKHPELEWCQHKAPRRMVAEVARHRARSTASRFTYTPVVRNAAFRDWGDDPFGGEWNSWNIGVRSWDVKPQIVEQFADHEIFIGGEACSDAQGWVVGALPTADMMLEKFGLFPL